MKKWLSIVNHLIVIGFVVYGYLMGYGEYLIFKIVWGLLLLSYVVLIVVKMMYAQQQRKIRKS